jgi:hypothetical protein
MLNEDPRRSVKIGKEAMRLGTRDAQRPGDGPRECVSRLLHEILCSCVTGFRAPKTLPRCARNGEMKRSSSYKLPANFLVTIVGTAAAIRHLALRAQESLSLEGSGANPDC